MPPQGVPEKFHLTVGFLEEPPFINLAPPDPVSGRCNVDRGVPCRVTGPTFAKEGENGEPIMTSSTEYVAMTLLREQRATLMILLIFLFRSPGGNSSNSGYQFQCCSGFCIDLLAKFADDLQFEYDLIRVEDPKWGIFRVIKTDR